MNLSVCNICGANYEYRNGRWVCPACGAYKPEELSNEEATLLFVAAQKRRLANFGEAENAYTDIIEKYPHNPYGYWGRLLSKHGIKYECDFDGQMLPTCCMPLMDSLFTDNDCLRAIDLSDEETKRYFTRQAEKIESIRKEWIEKASKEKPYDIFICYKDSDLVNDIERTNDSIVMQDLYVHLEKQGYRVFYSRESLRNKTGEKYEPYIFHAISTAKIMIVYASNPEYVTSTWLKNEWTRYQSLIKSGEKSANSLIVSYEGFNPHQLPTSLSSSQCIDASRKTFFHDIDSEIKEILGDTQKKTTTTKQTSVRNNVDEDADRAAFELFARQLSEIEATQDNSNKKLKNKALLIKSYRLPRSLSVLSDFVLLAFSNVNFETFNILRDKGDVQKALAISWVHKIEEAYELALINNDGSENIVLITNLHNKMQKKIRTEKVKAPLLLVASILAVFLAFAFLFALTNNDSDSDLVSITTTTTVQNQGGTSVDIDSFVAGFEKAEFDKFNSYASENGLGGSLIYIEGTITNIEIVAASGTQGQGIVGTITDTDGNQWLIHMHAVPIVSESAFDSTLNKEVVITCEYDGFSAVRQMPCVTLDELMIKDTGTIIFGMRKVLQ